MALANPNALLMATSCFNAVNLIGWPESRITLAEATIYLATSPKSNSAYQAINDAQKLVRESGDLASSTSYQKCTNKTDERPWYGDNYKYAHSYEGNFIQDNFLPENIKDRILYKPQLNSKEQEILKRLQNQWKGKIQVLVFWVLLYFNLMINSI
ncbi:MAG: hypothetical protein MZV63_41655 [Marinilabiliales bacterium]|nr:hypothetical protein [Marinilabiliales bacterium]